MNIATTIMPAAVQDVSATPLRVLLTHRNDLMVRLNGAASFTDEEDSAMCSRVNCLDSVVVSSTARTADDAIAKLIALAQISAEGHEATDIDAASAVADAQRFFGLGYLHHSHVAAIEASRSAPVPDQAILDAYAARRREFEETYHSDMTQEEGDAYFDRIDAYEAVIHDTPARTIAGVVAKLRVVFVHQTGEPWSDLAISDPTQPAFVKGLADAGLFARQAWAAIEDLARLGGVDLAAQGLDAVATMPPTRSPIETLRLEYADLDHQVNTTITGADNDPRVSTMQMRMKEIEQQITRQPSQSVADAKAKMRFLMDTASYGVPLDGEETHIIVKDAARFLVGEEA